MIRGKLALAVAALLVITAVTYLPALRNRFIWDDDDHFTQNPAMVQPDGLRRIWSSLAVSRYYPLTLTNFWVQRRLWGLNPLPYHAVNILTHAGAAVFAFLALRRLNVRAAWVAAALWAVHPVNVESVAWITELKNTQSGLFFFAAVFCFLRFETDRSPGWYAAAFACGVAAMLSKPSAVVLPAVLLLCAWWQRRKIERTDIERCVPFLVFAAGMSLLTIVEQRGHIVRGPKDWTLGSFERPILAAKAIWFYAAKIIWPFDLILIYPRWNLSAEVASGFACTAGVVALVFVLWRWRTRDWARALTFGLGYFVIALLPVLGFLDIYYFRYSFVADHFQYLASFGIVALVAAAGATVLRTRTTQTLATVAILTGLGMLSWKHNSVFHDEETSWRDTLTKNPEAFVAYNNLGVMANTRKDYIQSEKDFRAALRVKPDFLEARSNLGLSLTEQKRYAEAERALWEALDVKPDYNKAHYCLGHLYYNQGRLADAEKELYLAATSKTDPPMAEAYFDLGSLLQEKGRRVDAMRCYRIALDIRPDYAMAHSNLAILLAEVGNTEEAIAHCKLALQAMPDVPEVHHNLALALQASGLLDDAIVHFRKVLELKPTFADAYLGLGKTFVAKHEYVQAINAFRRGLEVEPRHMVMGNEMAWVMATAPDDAARNAPQAIQIGERLTELTQRKEPKPLDTLAAAYADAGRYDDAVRTAREALAVAGSQHATNLTAAIEKRLTLYQQGKPYRLTSP